jgi:ribose transport system ATP-binding protein
MNLADHERPLLEIDDLSKSYGSVQALDSVNFTLNSGEVMALLGENGAGKSTLVKVLSGLISPDSGIIQLRGKQIELGSPHAAREAGIAVVQQEISMIPTLTIAENLFLGTTEFKGLWTRSRLAARARPLLEQIGLDDLDPWRIAGTLSIGELQLVEIARLLSRNAEIFILDEPTAALSNIEIERVHDVVRRLTESGFAVIYVTHRLGEVFTLADRATIFRNGKSLDPVFVKDLTLDTLVERLLGRHLGDMYPERASELGAESVKIVDLESPGLMEPVSLSARKGEILGLAGQLGSGTTSVLRAMVGNGYTASGTVHVDGKDISGASLRGALRSGVAYASDDRKRDGVFQRQTVRTNLSAPALSRISRGGWVSNRKENVLATLSMEKFAIASDRIGSMAGNLSGGNQQKVAVGKWLSISPGVLLLEEPTRGVDVGARAEIYRNLRDLAEEGLTIIFSSSDLAEVKGLADSVATFYRGRLVRISSAEAMTMEQLLLDVTHDPDMPISPSAANSGDAS